jgi:hypothetical protein
MCGLCDGKKSEVILLGTFILCLLLVSVSGVFAHNVLDRYREDFEVAREYLWTTNIRVDQFTGQNIIDVKYPFLYTECYWYIVPKMVPIHQKKGRSSFSVFSLYCSDIYNPTINELKSDLKLGQYSLTIPKDQERVTKKLTVNIPADRVGWGKSTCADWFYNNKSIPRCDGPAVDDYLNAQQPVKVELEISWSIDKWNLKTFEVYKRVWTGSWYDPYDFKKIEKNGDVYLLEKGRRYLFEVREPPQFHAVEYNIGRYPCAIDYDETCSSGAEDDEQSVYFTPQQEIKSKKVTASVLGERIRTTITTQRGRIKIKNLTKNKSPTDKKKLPFLVTTRESDSLVSPRQKLQFKWTGSDTPQSLKVQLKSKFWNPKSQKKTKYRTLATKSVNNKKSDSFPLDLTSDTVWDTINHPKAEPGKKTIARTVRAENGRAQSPVKIKFIATFEDGDTEAKTIKQHKGKPYYSVVRQEYEDVKAQTQKGRKQAAFLPTRVYGGKFTKIDNSQFYDLINLSYDYSSNYGYFRRTMEESLDKVTQEMRSIKNKNGNAKYSNWKFDVISGFRNPVHNGTLKQQGLTSENPSGNSQHIYGFATDVRKMAATTKSRKELQRHLYNLLENKKLQDGRGYAGSFYGDASLSSWYQQTSPHINWPKLP